MTVSKELIQNVKDLKVALNEISVYDLDVYTSMELYYKIANKLNEVIKELARFEGVVSNEVVEQNEKLIYLLGEGLTIEVVKKINQMVTDGTFDTIINHNIFNGLNTKIDNFKREVDKQFISITTICDNIEELQNLIYNYNGRGVLKLSQGKNYTIKTKIIIDKEITLDGNNATIHVDFTNFASEVFFITSNNVKIKNLNFIGSGTINTLEYKAFIKSISENSLIENCTFENGMQGVHFSTSLCKNSTVRNSYSKNCFGSGFINLGGYYNNIENCIAESCGDGAISLFNSQYSKVNNCTVLLSDQAITIDAGSISNIVTNNSVVGNNVDSYYGIDVKNNSHSNVISNNSVSKVRVGIACRYGDPNQQNTSSNNLVVNNTINEISGVNSCGILVESQFSCSIIDNNLNRCDCINIKCNNAGTYNKNIIIKGNMLNLHGVNFGNMPYLGINKNAIKIEGFENVKIQDNIIQNSPELMSVYCIDINNCNNFTIGNNVITNITYRAINVNGLSFGVITNNSFVNTRDKILELYLNSNGFIKVEGNLQTGSNSGYFILAETETEIYATNNKFSSLQTDAINCRGSKRLFNNENISNSGLNGGQLRFTDKLEIFNGIEWTLV